MMDVLWQSITEVAPPTPQFTDEHVSDLEGKTYLVTGGSYGVGRELAKVLYSKNAIVYLGTRSETRFNDAVEYIAADAASSKGELRLLQMDQMDLPTVVRAAQKIISEVKRLDSVWYNAGVMGHPTLTHTVQGFELHWGTNVVAHFLLNALLTDLLLKSARESNGEESGEWGKVRAIWVASDASLFSPGADGINWDDINYENSAASQMTLYGQSKAAAIIMANEFAKRHGDDIVSLSLNPGHLVTGMQENRPKWLQKLGNLFSYHPKYGAYTELFAGFSKVDKSQNGSYVVPWGRFGTPKTTLREGLRARDIGARLWDLLEQEIKPYV
ncbi:hypothetical protein BZA70DRAFT_165529 [Myxozyma melibiosi]|uniref:Short-chain dehydrogenase n=1 Tax=Myxozyma melibiosi TaxID=54550 RepID=A0ABR1F734_9ASCO